MLSSVGSLVIASRLEAIESVCMVVLFLNSSGILINKNFVWLETYYHCFQYSEVGHIIVAIALSLLCVCYVIINEFGKLGSTVLWCSLFLLLQKHMRVYVCLCVCI